MRVCILVVFVLVVAVLVGFVLVVVILVVAHLAVVVLVAVVSAVVLRAFVVFIVAVSVVIVLLVFVVAIPVCIVVFLSTFWSSAFPRRRLRRCCLGRHLLGLRFLAVVALSFCHPGRRHLCCRGRGHPGCRRLGRRRLGRRCPGCPPMDRRLGRRRFGRRRPSTRRRLGSFWLSSSYSCHSISLHAQSPAWAAAERACSVADHFKLRRSHFVSRYTLGCCILAGLLGFASLPRDHQ